MSLLSSEALPVARRIESWLPDGHGRLQRAYGFCEIEGRLPADDAAVLAANSDAAIVQAWRTGAARAVSGYGALGAIDVGAGGFDVPQSMLAIPVIADDAVAEVVALYF